MDVYPQLYLVKNRVANDEEVHRSIQKKVLEVINEQQSSESLTIKESEQYFLDLPPLDPKIPKIFACFFFETLRASMIFGLFPLVEIGSIKSPF